MAKSPQLGILNGKVSWLHAWRLQNGSCPQNPFPDGTTETGWESDAALVSHGLSLGSSGAVWW